MKKLVPPRIQIPIWRKSERKTPMSILIGIICPDGIVVASDSHITDILQGTYSSVDKISVVDFSDQQVLIAQAGAQSVTNRVVDKIREKASGIKIANENTVIKIVEDSIRETNEPLSEQQKDYVRQHGAELMVAFYIGKSPHLYVVSVLGDGILVPSEKPFATSGVGSYLASYLLDEHAEPKAGTSLAFATLIFVLKKVKDTTKFCGGDTVVKWLCPSPIRLRARCIPRAFRPSAVPRSAVRGAGSCRSCPPDDVASRLRLESGHRPDATRGRKFAAGFGQTLTGRWKPSVTS